MRLGLGDVAPAAADHDRELELPVMTSPGGHSTTSSRAPQSALGRPTNMYGSLLFRVPSWSLGLSAQLLDGPVVTLDAERETTISRTCLW